VRDDAPRAGRFGARGPISALVATLLAAACARQAPTARPSQLDSPCTQPADCIGGLACIDGTCIACRDKNDCPDGTCGDSGRCVGVPFNGPCRDASDCAPGIECVLNQCQGCNGNEDCVAGVCLWDSHVCGGEDSCNWDEDCPVGACIDATHLCGGEGSCRSDDDCQMDEICDHQLCIFSA